MTETNEATAPAMRAMTYETYGGPENLALTEQPRPKVGPGEVLVRVRSASVNPVDWKLMSGGLDPVMDVRFPVVPGWDVAGVVEAVGFDTPEFSSGDEVLAYARKDYVHGGTFAELVSVPVRALAAQAGVDVVGRGSRAAARRTHRAAPAAAPRGRRGRHRPRARRRRRRRLARGPDRPVARRPRHRHGVASATTTASVSSGPSR